MNRTHVEEIIKLPHKASANLESRGETENWKTKEHIALGIGIRHEKDEIATENNWKEQSRTELDAVSRFSLVV